MQVSRDLNILNEDLIKQKFRIDAQKWKLWGLARIQAVQSFS